MGAIRHYRIAFFIKSIKNKYKPGEQGVRHKQKQTCHKQESHTVLILAMAGW